MTDLIQTLQAIRDEYAHERNAWSHPPLGEAEKYARWCARAQTKVDALNEAIAILTKAEELDADPASAIEALRSDLKKLAAGEAA